MTQLEALSSIDTAWLRMDRPTNLMVICGMLMFADKLELRRVREVVATRMLRFHRFRQRVAERDGAAFWEEDAGFALDWHVRRIGVPRGHGQDGLAQAVSELASTPLDRARPMWQIHLVDDTCGGCALVLRIHHCYADGFALTHVLASMTDAGPRAHHAAVEDVDGHGVRRAAWESLLGPVTQTAGDMLRSTRAMFELGLQWIGRPAGAAGLGLAGAGLVREAADVALMKPDAHTRLKGPLGVMKRAAWARPLSLFEVKAVAEAFGCSVNDVLLACVSGALRGYLAERGDPVDEVEIRALVPVNMRPPGPPRELGNRFGLVFLDLPVGIGNMTERVLEVKRRMDELKHSQQPLVSLGILASMGLIPEMLKEKALETLAANASAVITNVRGAPDARYFAGKRITRQVFWVPQSGGIGMGISILSYAGKIDFGLITDVMRVPDPERIVGRFAAEFDALLLGVLMMPWPQAAQPLCGSDQFADPEHAAWARPERNPAKDPSARLS